MNIHRNELGMGLAPSATHTESGARSVSASDSLPPVCVSVNPPPLPTAPCRRGATVHFSCDEGYELQGSKSISCLRVTDSYVGWSDDRPICRGRPAINGFLPHGPLHADGACFIRQSERYRPGRCLTIFRGFS